VLTGQIKFVVKAYTDIYVNTQQLLLNATLFYTWRHVLAAHTAIFRPAYNRTGPFMCAQYGIPHCLHIKHVPSSSIRTPELKSLSVASISILINSALLRNLFLATLTYSYRTHLQPHVSLIHVLYM